MPSPSLGRSSEQLLSHVGETPLHAREAVADWAADSLVSEVLGRTNIVTSDGVPVAAASDEKPDSFRASMLASGQLIPGTPFYGLGHDLAPYNPEVARLKEAAHDLVQAGLVDEAQLERLSLRVQNGSVPTPEPLQAAELAYAATSESQNAISEAELTGGQTILDSTSASYHYGAINVNEKETGSLMPGLSRDANMMGSFLHELGHATLPSDKLLESVTQNLQNLDGSSPLDSSATIAALAPRCETKNLRVMVGEMYADAFQVVGTLAREGKDAALAQLDGNLELRRDELSNFVAFKDGIGKPTFVEDHHTTETLNVLRDKLLSGEAEKALQDGQANAFLLDVTAQGYVNEYIHSRMANINPHFTTEDGLQPGLPPGLTEGELLRADAQGGGTCRGATGMTVLLPEGAVDSLAEQGVGLADAKVSPAGKKLADFDVVETPSTTLTFEDARTGQVLNVYGGISPTEQYLSEHGADVDWVKVNEAIAKVKNESAPDTAAPPSIGEAADGASPAERAESEDAAAEQAAEAEMDAGM